MRTAIITGAGRGIGLALTKQFLKNSYQVLATYRSEKSAMELLQLAEEHSELKTVQMDIAQPSSYKNFLLKMKDFQSIDVLVNNAGVIGAKSSSLMELDMSIVEATFQVNTFGPMRVTQAVLPHLSKNGKIAHITSLMGSITDNSSGGYYDYRMSKAALNMFNKSLSKDFPELTCLVLHPGWVQTAMGGSGAPVTVVESASGLFERIEGAKLSQSGHFYNYSGNELPW